MCSTDLVHSCVGEQQRRVFVWDDAAGVDILVRLLPDEVVHEHIPDLGAGEVGVHWCLRGKRTTDDVFASRRKKRSG